MSPEVTNDKASMQPIEPVVMAVIGTGTGDGGAPLKDGQMLKTPDHQPNVVIQVITPVVALVIRFANAYVTTLIGLVTVGLTSDALPAADFYHLVIRCASLSLAGPAVSLGKDCITILSGLEKKFPVATGSI